MTSPSSSLAPPDPPQPRRSSPAPSRRGAIPRSLTGLGLEAARILRDRFDHSSPVPRTIDELDPSYLSKLLRRRVSAVEVLDRTAGTTARARLRLCGDAVRCGMREGASESAPQSTSQSIFVKIAPTAPSVRLFANLANLGRVESGFYADIRPHLDIETPAVFGIDSDPATKRFVIAIEDLTSRGVRFTDTVTGVTPGEAMPVVDTLARLHGALWDSPRLSQSGPGGLSWIHSNSGDPSLPLIQRALVAAGRRLFKRCPEYAPPVGLRILERYLAVADELDAGPHTVLHGDPHPGNVYFADDPVTGSDSLRGGLFDWQVLRRGNGMRDVTYFLVFGLEPQERRRRTGTLLERYRESLAEAGGPRLDPDAVFEDYRKMVAYAYAAAAFTGAFGLRLQSEEVALSGVRKAAEALADLDTGQSLSSLA